MIQPLEIGTEFQINSTTISAQNAPQVAVLSGGGNVVIWQDQSQVGTDTSALAIRGRIYGADGLPISGSDFEINATTTGSQLNAVVAKLAGNRFVVAWEDGSATGADTDGTAIRYRVFEGDGTALTAGDFVANSIATGFQMVPTITSLANGGFALAWADVGGTRLRFFDGTGNPILGSEQLIAVGIDQSRAGAPSITTLSDGRLALAWRDDDLNIHAQVFNADGTVSVAEYTVNNASLLGPQSEPSIAALATGGFVISWTDGEFFNDRDVRVQAFNASGAEVGSETVFHSTDPLFVRNMASDVTGLKDGGFVVVWTNNQGNSSFSHIYGQQFSEGGTAVGDTFLITDLRHDPVPSPSDYQYDPDVVTLADGSFLVTWTNRDPPVSVFDIPNDDVYGQRFAPLLVDAPSAFTADQIFTQEQKGKLAFLESFPLDLGQGL